ncbi:hypothetical protein VSO76_07545 [Klebsiella pneumoniae]|uniref:hypothetical protein n=1 Tax=Klebsiella pneumoniae TaxID=573 RepID=UPI002DB6F248|nr:hypothetical protein [Klebsiella pneumoniae]MEC4056088.1 hypothetical protein [Klebsiella pneumoniae]
MTSKLTRERLEELAAGQSGFNLRIATHEESQELARMALAAMDGKPVLEIESEPVFTLEVAREDYKGQKLGNHFGFITLDAARELKEGNYQLYTAQPVPVVPDDVLDALQKVARIRLDLNDFDGDRRGIADCLGDAEDALIEVVNRRAAMLHAGNSPAQSPIDHGYQPECGCSGCKATSRICAELAGNPPANPGCWCRTCRPVDLNDMRFVVCPDCGNKRCPRANDHRNACTGSNEPGQEGSAYPDTPQEVKGE